MPAPMRRVIAGHDASGKAVILEDRPAPNVVVRQPAGIASSLMWVMDQVPEDLTKFVDPTIDKKVSICPPKTGVYFRVIEFPPENEEDVKRAQESGGAESPGGAHGEAGLARPEGARHPGMHRTESIDFALIMKGEIDMMVDEDEVHLKQGDVLIQLGCNHAWVNRSGAPCHIAFILIGADVDWA